MPKEEFLMLAHKFDASKFFRGMWASEKLDGCRAFWDGGVTIGKPVSDVPWSTDERDLYSTGLWSRGRKSIQAPDWWIQHLPEFTLDGELWLGYNKFQDLMSVVRRHNPDERWHNVTYHVFDSPPMFFFSDQYPGWQKHKTLKQVYGIFENQLTDRVITRPVHQYILDDLEDAEYIYQRTLDQGGEGLIIRDPSSVWKPHRSRDILKYKPYLDDEATVIGYTWAREGKLYGLMGALICEYKGNRFQLSGFTDSERHLDNDDGAPINPGREVPRSVTSPHFPRGSRITFRYRELTNDGIPKEARFLRHRPGGE